MTPPSLRFGAPWPGVKKHRGVGRDVGLAKSGRARARLIREAKLFSEKSSQENKIFVDCSAESTKGRIEFRFGVTEMLSAVLRHRERPANARLRTANGERNEACGRAPRAMRERSPHCGTGVLARRFAFAGCEILEVCDGLRQKQRARAPVLHSIATANGER